LPVRVQSENRRFRPVRRVALVLLVALLGACTGGDDSGPQERTVRVDFSHDEFGSYFLEYYPRKITLRPGDTAVFRQTWTGEPHSVTMGTLVDDLVSLVDPYIEAMKEGEPLPEDPPADVQAAEQILPYMFGESFEDVNQAAAQPCYIESGGTIPEDVKEPCEEQTQTPFKGTETYYNSGFIPYEGSGGNEFRVPLSEDIDEGTYYYYCNYHGALMSGAITVVGEGERIPSQDELNRQAREEIEFAAQPLRDELQKAQDGELEVPEDQAAFLRESGHLRPGTNFFRGNLSGLYAESSFVGGINEFIPKEIEAEAGEKVTWINLGQHTISFDVPRYFPIISVEDDGTVVYNPRISPAAGGAPQPPEPNFEDETPEPMVIDAGTWDGEGFFSSGLIAADPYVEYSITFSRPGTYKYACLIHPPMTGTITVR
jgi:plastocyanin